MSVKVMYNYVLNNDIIIVKYLLALISYYVVLSEILVVIYFVGFVLERQLYSKYC